MNYVLNMDSPIGNLVLEANDEALVAIHFPIENIVMDDTDPSPILHDAKQQLDRYFQGKLTHFDLPLAPNGTPFRLQVWQQLQTIPYGETRSYAWLAQSINNPKAVRAVGTANGANKLPIVIPCHRVIASDGSLAGFGGGLPSKQYLLDLEAKQQPLPLVS